MTGFEDLDDDVLYLILDYLYLERAAALRTLRLTSLRLKDFAEAVAHRTVSLIDDESHELITYRLAERLTDPSDKLCHYVRNLCIVHFKGNTNSYCLNIDLIVDCLRHVQRLDTFSWNCDAPIPFKLLNDLQQRFPNAQLCANVRLVGQTLLPMPQLHRLNVSIPCAHLLGDYSISLFGALKQALLHVPNLRHLAVDTHHDSNVGRLEDAALDRLQLPLQPGDRLPSLVSLDLRSTSYVYDVAHCKCLLTSLDCSKLQNLTIGANNPTVFFEEFHQHLPQLSHLDISSAFDRDDLRDLRLLVCANFIATLPSLRSLVLRVDDLNIRSDFCKTLTDVHGPTLRHLSIQARQEHTEGPLYRGNIRKFLFKFTALQSLRMAFPDLRSYHRCPDCEGYTWGEPNHFSFVPPLPSLHTVHLSIRAPFTEGPLYAYINKHAHCAICHLWTTFADRAGSQLETLGIRFWRWKATGRQTGLKEVVYESTRLRGRLEVKGRHERGIERVVYREVWEEGRGLVAFEV